MLYTTSWRLSGGTRFHLLGFASTRPTRTTRPIQKIRSARAFRPLFSEQMQATSELGTHACMLSAWRRAPFSTVSRIRVSQTTDNTSNGNASEQAAAQAPGTFMMKAMINTSTGIMCVTLPVFDCEKPMKGTKAARVS